MPDEGFRKWLGVEYEVMEEGHAVVGLNITDDMRNLRGVVQGGVIAALVDIAMATAAAGGNYDTRRRPMATLEMKVNYLAAATGERLTAVADVIRAGSRTAVTRCEVFFGDAEVCAAGLGTFMTRRVHATDPKDMPPPAG
ncbi:MAG: PaaI family thioesterase [Alphaproteobacteria bacterium]|nr:PaaI family thioesterase [Alphaproteobacteria bacterium]